MTTYVTATEWGVSYTCPQRTVNAYGYEPDAMAKVTLNVHKLVDEPNKWGGRGVVVRHPVYDGLEFDDKDEAKSFSIEVGLLKVFEPREVRMVASMERTLDKLDVEEDDKERALLIDHAISLADLDQACADLWREYR